MKKIILILILILTCGFASTYNLNVSNNYFRENIEFAVAKDIPQVIVIDDTEIDDQYSYLIDNKYVALNNKNKYYNKHVSEDDKFYYMNLKYNYNEKKLKNANYINTCFEESKLDLSKSYDIKLTGKFYCLVNQSLEINIKTNNKVLYSNAYKVENNVYTWVINGNNVDNVDIEIQMKKGFPYRDIIKGIIITIAVVLIIIFIIYLIKKRKEKINRV